MSDGRIRELERRAALGDPEAERRLRRALLRADLAKHPRLWLTARGHVLFPAMMVKGLGTDKITFQAHHGTYHLCVYRDPAPQTRPSVVSVSRRGLTTQRILDRAWSAKARMKTGAGAAIWMDLTDDRFEQCNKCFNLLAETEGGWETIWQKQLVLGQLLGRPYEHPGKEWDR